MFFLKSCIRDFQREIQLFPQKGVEKENCMKNRAGFSLVELMVVIVVIAVLAGVAVPAMNSLKERHGFSGALQDVLLTLRQARLVAVEENETVMVAVDVAGGTYRAFVDDGGDDATDNNGPFAPQPDGIPDKARNGVFDGGERIINSGTVPDGVRFTSANFSGNTNFQYDNRGFPTDAAGLLMDGTITLASDLGGSRQINLLRSGHSVIQ